MFIASEMRGARTPSGVPCTDEGDLHFTPDGVRTPAALMTINMALLTEGNRTEGNRQTSLCRIARRMFGAQRRQSWNQWQTEIST
jgi:hypothetical protein